ncbi:S1 family peptidase [Mumia sp. zg.B53]|uniref:S1 family peptidase n=1 Tax=Mumia sp. zg.B53 TaxID=2855449 RepID=UPI001C6EEB1B|nr:S1 family peptidase [Mumia sp. zg.B53]MBW9214791.1 S1 family peptidase [Mumia sp. zg.B53]
MPTPRQPITAIAALVLGIGLLAAAGGAAQGDDAALTPDKRALVAEAEAVEDAAAASDQPPALAYDGPIATSLQRAVADRVTELLTPQGDKPADGVPVSLDAGVIGVTGSPTAGYTLVVTRGTDGAALVNRLTSGLSATARRLLTVRTSERTAQELRDAWVGVTAQQWRTADAAPTAGYSMDLDPELEAVVVDVAAAPPRAAARLDRQAAPVEGVDAGAVVVRYTGSAARASRTSDTSPHWGGARITSPSKVCSSGFTVRSKSSSTRYSVTAGHCGANGTSWYSGSYYFGQIAGRSNYPAYDQARLAGSTYTNSIYTDGLDNFNVRTVTGANDGAVGDNVCASGAVTKSVCGIEIKSLSASYCDDPAKPATCSTYLMRGRRSDDRVIARLGDSGGPVYQRNTTQSRASIRAMVVAYDMSGVRMYAERYNSISNHLGVIAVTS